VSFGDTSVINMVQSGDLGRRIVFVATAMMSTIFGGVSALAQNLVTLIVLRALMGVAIGGNLSIDIIFFMEFLPSQYRGRQTTTIILCGIGGCTLQLI
jgi:predicted MFS family arabinose efflux permease